MECLITAMGNDDLPHIRREAAIMLLDPFILELQEAGHLVEPCLQSFMSCLESPVPSLRRNRASAGGNSQSWNGAPLRNAPGLVTSTGR